MREIGEISIPLKKSHSRNIQQNVDDVVVLAVSSSRSDLIQSNAASGDASERCTRTAHQRLRLSGPARYGGVVDGIDSTTTWCLWWRVCVDRPSPICMVEEERRKEASETGQRLRAKLGLPWTTGSGPFISVVR
jgi:hypothetical protein